MHAAHMICPERNKIRRAAEPRHGTAQHVTPRQHLHNFLVSSLVNIRRPHNPPPPPAKPKGHVLLSQTPHQCLGALASRAVLSKPCGDGGICRLRYTLWGPSVMSLGVRCSSAFQRLYPLVWSKA